LRRDCLLNYVITGKLEGRIEERGGRRRGSKQLLDDLKENRGYYKLKEEAVNCTVRRFGFGRFCRPVVRQTAD
jgi:hypothetical protein